MPEQRIRRHVRLRYRAEIYWQKLTKAQKTAAMDLMTRARDIFNAQSITDPHDPMKEPGFCYRGNEKFSYLRTRDFQCQPSLVRRNIDL